MEPTRKQTAATPTNVINWSKPIEAITMSKFRAPDSFDFWQPAH